MKTILFLIILSAFIFSSTAQTTVNKIDSVEINNLVHKVFNVQYPFFENYINGKAKTKLYDIQTLTNPLLEGAFNSKQYAILDSLAMLYLNAYKFLEKVDTMYINYTGRIDTVILDNSCMVWLNDYTLENITFKNEQTLYTTQFSYVLSRSIHHFIEMKMLGEYKNIDSLLKVYPEFLVNDFYKRIIFNKDGMFQIRGWGCIKGTYNHYELLQLKAKNKFRGKISYCRSVTDSDMWLIAGVAEILMANKLNPEIVVIDDDLKTQFIEYLNFSLKFVEKRMNKAKLADFNGNKIFAYDFDNKAWIDHEDNAYGNCECDTFPLESDKLKIKKIGWDLSHARRFVNFFESIYEYSTVFNKSFPDSSTLKYLSNQFIYKVFNGDYKKPLFANYYDGSNGWYRYGYHGKGFGYAPSDMSSSVLSGGFCFLGKYNKDIIKLRNSLWEMLLSENNEIIEHREEHYGKNYNKGKRTKKVNYFDLKSTQSIILLQFLPTFY